MSTDDKRDVAKDLVDFLLNESKKPDETVLHDRPKKSDDGRTAVLSNDEDTATKSFSKPQMATERSQAIYNEVSKLVGGVEAVRVAQARILELEKERDELRNQIDELLVTTEALQRQVAETKSQFENVERKQKQKMEINEEEKIVMQERLKAREKELSEIKKTNEELENRFQNDLKKIRYREKEYENKNVILRAEANAVGRAKDEMILDLRQKIDQFQNEIDNFKSKFSQTGAQLNEIREREIRAIKALRLALNILETDDTEETTQVNISLKASGDE